MKKLVALLLAFGLLLTSFSALADAPVVKSTLPQDVYRNNPVPIFEITYRGTPYNWEIFRIENGVSSPATVTNTNKTPLKKTGLTESTIVSWDYLNFGDYTKNDGGLNHQLVVSTEDGTQTIANFYVNWFANGLFDRVSLQSWIDPETPDENQEDFEEPTEEPIEEPTEEPTEEPIEEPTEEPTEKPTEEPEITAAKWYPHNTICVAGLEFREEKPSLTKNWYNFAAVDLSQEGKQVFELVASNKYVIGTVEVVRTGDEVTVQWKLNKQGTKDANFISESEFLTFFHNLSEVKSVNPSDIEKSYEFGQPISITNDLDGDTNVLLYILNKATYCDNLSYKNQRAIYHPLYWRNLSFRVQLRNAMKALMAADAQ